MCEMGEMILMSLNITLLYDFKRGTVTRCDHRRQQLKLSGDNRDKRSKKSMVLSRVIF